jgi:hypothetical protein
MYVLLYEAQYRYRQAGRTDIFLLSSGTAGVKQIDQSTRLPTISLMNTCPCVRALACVGSMIEIVVRDGVSHCLLIDEHI